MKLLVTHAAIVSLAVLSAPVAAVAQSPLDMQGDAVVSVNQAHLSMNVPLSAFPAPGTAAPIYSDATRPFNIAVALPTSGSWTLVVRVSSDFTLAGGIETINANALEYSLALLPGSTADNCTLTTTSVPSVWLPVGTGAITAAMSGPGVCRFDARFRLTLEGRVLPGNYSGEVAWSVQRQSR